MIDFAALALGPGIAAFGRPVQIHPDRSAPGQPAYALSGVWSTRNTEISLLGEGVMNTRSIRVGIRLSDCPSSPTSGDRVDVPAAGSLTDEGTFTIDDVDLDGQGGATLILKGDDPLQ